eukprot:gene53381-71360_t
MAKEELIEFEGEVTEVLPDARFRVRLDTGHEMIAYTAGKMKKNRIKTIEGDRVTVEMSPYDLEKGRACIFRAPAAAARWQHASPLRVPTAMKKEELELRKAIIAKCRWMNAAGLNQGTSGNISARYKDRMLITPSATPYDEMEPEMICSMPFTGEYGAYHGPLKPSTEWRFHFDIMTSRPDVGAIVHTHATYSTILSIAGKSIP